MSTFNRPVWVIHGETGAVSVTIVPVDGDTVGHWIEVEGPDDPMLLSATHARRLGEALIESADAAEQMTDRTVK